MLPAAEIWMDWGKLLVERKRDVKELEGITAANTSLTQKQILHKGSYFVLSSQTISDCGFRILGLKFGSIS